MGTNVRAEKNDGPKGPLPTPNRFAPHLMLLTPLPESPRTLPKGGLDLSAGLDYSSVFFYESSSTHDILVDMEMVVLDLMVEYGLTPAITLGAHTSLVSMQNGFLDRPLKAYHDAFGFPNYDRQVRPDDRFAYHYLKEDQPWFNAVSGGLHATDMDLKVKCRLIAADAAQPLTAGLAYHIKLPTGEVDSGFSSGGIDHGLFLPTQLFWEPMVIYISPGLILHGRPTQPNATVTTRDSVSLLLGAEYMVSQRTSAVAQVQYYTSPLEYTGISKMDNGSLELTLGVIRFITRSWSWSVSFSEDLTRAAPDFNIGVRLHYRL